MRIAHNRTVGEVPRAQLESMIRQCPRVLVDIGTGDGKFVYLTAQRQPDWFCIGVDADLSSLSEHSRKSQRKPERGGLPNVMYVVSGVEDLPPELDGIADRVTAHLPWGSLLVGIVQADADVLSGLARVGKPVAELVLLCAGSARVEVDDRAVAQLHAGTLCGEMAFISGEPASATVIVRQPVRAFVFDMRKLRALVEEDELVASAIHHAVGRDLMQKVNRNNSAAAHPG